ncbi:hypothetical protein PanWU01x14_285920 [Parasponia andersonii]|uniref:Uncharacterized protein n=1 Tax=Parasponia andersonii TaxID=3476 RepID=A0A2P5AZH9_PARAD|nr:hypothetical protein PanWU01x14_285920 [Parasponia andersonii]
MGRTGLVQPTFASHEIQPVNDEVISKYKENVKQSKTSLTLGYLQDDQDRDIRTFQRELYKVTSSKVIIVPYKISLNA